MSDFTRPKAQYSPQDEATFRDAVDTALGKTYTRGQSVEMWPGTSVVLRTATGARKRLIVHDDDTVTCEDA